jgi:hypothetical protein
MKIVSIEIDNILGLQRASIACTAPITLIAGGNEAGKSSLCDAISMALTGKPRRVNLKKDLAQLVNDTAGAKKGRVTLVGEGDELLGQFKLPKGEHELAASLEQLPGYEFLPLVLDAEAFSAMSHDDRRKALFRLAGCKASPEYITAELKAAGCDTELATQIIAIARSGFSAMSDEAKQRATQAKGEWKATTGETWGSDKADGWAVEVPVGPKVTQEEISEAAQAVAKIQADIENGMAHKGKLEEQQRAADEAAARNAAAADNAGNLPRLQAKLAATEKDLAEWTAKLADLKTKLDADDTYTCPCCNNDLSLADGRLTKATAGLSLAERKDLKERHTTAANSVAMFERTRLNDRKAVDAASSAVVEDVKGPEAGALDKTLDAIDKLRTRLATAQAKHSSLTERFDLINGAQATNEKATAAHNSIASWLAIAEQLAPAGIPAKLLSKALTPVNDALAQMAAISGWATPMLDSSMTITYGGRLFGLCSESAKWRCNTMLTLMIAQLSGIKFAVLDRLDVLELSARPQLCKMAAMLVDNKVIDSLIMCGTMKEAPRLPAHFQSLWIAGGVVTS